MIPLHWRAGRRATIIGRKIQKKASYLAVSLLMAICQRT